MAKKARNKAADSESSSSNPLQPLFEGMLTLLGRLVYPPEKLLEIVTFRKRNPEQYIAIYNLCDGEHTGSEIAKAFNQDQGGLSEILSGWKELGIVYEINKKGGKFYKKLYSLPLKKSEPPKEVESEPGPPKQEGSTSVTQAQSNDKS